MLPVRLTPRPLQKVWGGTTLAPWFANQREKTGEIWFEGVQDLPLLVKLLFTSEKLSVQVHPGDSDARLHHASPDQTLPAQTPPTQTPRGKTEMWHVLRAQPGARIAAGFIREISEKELRESAESGKIENLLQWHDAHVGDTFFIPAGTVHAIGEGLALCEIQQNSDITYRLYDYGRRRELHLDDAVRVSRRMPHAARMKPESTIATPPGPQIPSPPTHAQQTYEQQVSTRQTLVRCDYFTTERIELAGTLRHTPAPAQMEWWIVVEGSGEIAGQPLRTGEVWFIAPAPASDAPAPLELQGHAILLRATAPV